jgi:hypothetical protein
MLDGTPLPDKDGNTAGWWDSMYRFHPGRAVTHTRNSTPSGPDYCQECSDAESDWVRWPCPHTFNEEASHD